QNTALHKQHVKKHHNRRKPSHPSNFVDPSTIGTRNAQQIASLEPRILLLRGQPSRKRLPIIVINPSAQLLYDARYHHALCVPLLDILSALASIKSNPPVIKPPRTQPSINTIPK